MILRCKLTDLADGTTKQEILAKECTIGQAFTMIDNWCYDNDALLNWNFSRKSTRTMRMTVLATTETHEVTFTINHD